MSKLIGKKSDVKSRTRKRQPSLSRLCFCLLGLLLLNSCATIGRKFELTGVNQIGIETSTMSEVRSMFGDPMAEIDVATWGFKRVHFGDENTATIWRYVYSSGSVVEVHMKYLEVDFDGNGIVSDYDFSSDYNEDKTQEPDKKQRKDFDIFAAKNNIIPHKTDQTQVLSLLGPIHRVLTINKPDVKERWTYSYERKSTDEKVAVPTSAGVVRTNRYYAKGVAIDFNEKGIVVDISGESDFPEDKDKFFTKQE